MLLLAALLPASAQEQQRNRYREAMAALEDGRTADYQALLTQLDGYALRPYLEAEALRRRLPRAAFAEVDALLSAYPGLPPVERVRRLWLKHLARMGRHRELLAHYTAQTDVALRCAAVYARLELGLAASFEADLWLAGDSQPRQCDPVFAHFVASGSITADLHWERARLALSAGNGRLATYLGRRLSAERRAAIRRWVRLAQNPEGELARARHWPDSETNREMLHHTLKGMAVSRNDRARHYWRLLESRFAWSDPQRAALERELALYYATDYPADALAALKAVPALGVDVQITEWRARVALRAGDWAAVLEALNELPLERGRRPGWRYWRARALEALHRDEEATRLYAELANEANYYGFLSAPRVGADYALCPLPADADETVLERLRGLPAMQRAIELFHLDELHYARSEWNLASAGLGSEERRQTAILAAAEGWFERAILTLADGGEVRRYELRFPRSWESVVLPLARTNGLSPSLVFAVMRSESALAPDAVSSAGALGLMQLTPATARRLARARGDSPPSRSRLFGPELNIALGSAYLAELFERYRHPLTALAAYNAGPEAVDRWEALALPAEADRWIETVPYFETREYLARVIAFATIYDWLIEGKMIPLDLRMPALNLRPGRTDFGVSGSLVPSCPESLAGASE